MLRFKDFEALGLGVAAMSDKSDGDLARIGGDGDGYGSFFAACGVDSGEVVLVHQVHGRRVVVAGGQGGDGGSGGAIGDGDGLVTGRAGVPLGIRVADCVPVFLFDPVCGAGGIVHAGREGTFEGIAGEAVEVLSSALGAVPGRMHALIGPSAGPCCYEVSEEIAKSFHDKGFPIKGRFLDLWRSNVKQLVSGGVPFEQISLCEVCTICDGRFHSYRSDGGGGRNLALLVI